MDFMGREKEMTLLDAEFRKDHSLVIIKGRRRVGKSRLIEEFLKDTRIQHIRLSSDNSTRFSFNYRDSTVLMPSFYFGVSL